MPTIKSLNLIKVLVKKARFPSSKHDHVVKTMIIHVACALHAHTPSPNGKAFFLNGLAYRRNQMYAKLSISPSKVNQE